jgi:hypothetical protein
MRSLCLVVLAIAAGCSGGDDGKDKAQPPPPYVFDAVPVIDAGIEVALPDPAAAYHLDDDVPATPRRADRGATRDRRFVQLLLASTPSGAIAAVDGKVIGRTPVYWEGEFTGRDREFTFVLPGYAIARYRFVPIQNGHVHGRLQKVTDIGDAGVPEIPEPAPPEPPPEVPTRSSAPRRSGPAAPATPSDPPPPTRTAPPPDAAPAPPVDAAAPPPRERDPGE